MYEMQLNQYSPNEALGAYKHKKILRKINGPNTMFGNRPNFLAKKCHCGFLSRAKCTEETFKIAGFATYGMSNGTCPLDEDEERELD